MLHISLPTVRIYVNMRFFCSLPGLKPAIFTVNSNNYTEQNFWSRLKRLIMEWQTMYASILKCIIHNYGLFRILIRHTTMIKTFSTWTHWQVLAWASDLKPTKLLVLNPDSQILIITDLASLLISNQWKVILLNSLMRGVWCKTMEASINWTDSHRWFSDSEGPSKESLPATNIF